MWYSFEVQLKCNYQSFCRESPKEWQAKSFDTENEMPANNFSKRRKTPWFIGPVTKKPVIPRLMDCFLFLLHHLHRYTLPGFLRMQNLLANPITSKHGSRHKSHISQEIPCLGLKKTHMSKRMEMIVSLFSIYTCCGIHYHLVVIEETIINFG